MKCTTKKANQWQQELINAVTDPLELIELLDLSPDLIEPAKKAAALFPLKTPRSFIARMKKGDANDPLLKQVLPLHLEFDEIPGFSIDPLQEKDANPIPGLLHKYHGRVLLTFTSACGINCRYCFRRHFEYGKNNPGTEGWNDALDYISRDSSIHEVILSGGDPLVINDHALKIFIEKLAVIPHLKRLRFHSRMPIVMPERVTHEFITAITHTRLQTIMVVHCNHAQEIDEQVENAVRLLKQSGVTVLNQAVLLKDINDNVNTLVELSERLFETGIQPYYLHVLDKVTGAAHFDTPLQVAKSLHEAMKNQLSGYLVPKLVCEQPKAPAKTVINS